MKDACCLLFVLLLMISTAACDGDSGPGPDAGADAYAGDLYLGEGPTTSPVTDGPVPPDLSATQDDSAADYAASG
jgi:hypothetical protein